MGTNERTIASKNLNADKADRVIADADLQGINAGSPIVSVGNNGKVFYYFNNGGSDPDDRYSAGGLGDYIRFDREGSEKYGGNWGGIQVPLPDGNMQVFCHGKFANF